MLRQPNGNQPALYAVYAPKDNLDHASHWALFPGTTIFLTVLSINGIGDGLRDALDPRKVLTG